MPEMNWRRYGVCPECSAPAGRPCKDLRVRKYRIRQWPHPQRAAATASPDRRTEG